MLSRYRFVLLASMSVSRQAQPERALMAPKKKSRIITRSCASSLYSLLRPSGGELDGGGDQNEMSVEVGKGDKISPLA